MKDILQRILRKLVFRNYFIAFCATAMVFATYLLNNVEIKFTHFTIFLTCSTYLLYNFHIHSFQINYSGRSAFVKSIKALAIPVYEKVIFAFILFYTLFEFFFLSEKVLVWLFPLSILSLLYSIPVLGIKKKFRIRESVFIKLPLLASVWSLATVLIPLAEQNIPLYSPFIFQQICSRFLFVFALCIPFEIRDMEVDQKANVITLPVVIGEMKTKLLGAVLILVEMIIHYFMPVKENVIIALNLSSIIALIWIFVKDQKREGYFYKLFVDGTMILRFIFLYIVYNYL